MNSSNPKVSVVIPAYNRASVLSRAINSVLAQTYQDFEIIVVDDCSQDNIDEIMKSFVDSRINYIKHETNKGGNAARNTGIKVAKGELIAFLDSDDEWLATKLEKQVALFADPTIGLVYCGFNYIEEGNDIRQDRLTNLMNNYRQDLVVSNFVGTTSVAIVRKKLLNEINGFDEKMRSSQDWDLYLRLSDRCEFGCVSELLVNYFIDRKGKKQISTSAVDVLSGHDQIEEKFRARISELPKAKKLERIDYFLCIYVGMANFRGITLAWEGFSKSANPKYLIIILKIIVKFYLRKLRV